MQNYYKLYDLWREFMLQHEECFPGECSIIIKLKLIQVWYKNSLYAPTLKGDHTMWQKFIKTQAIPCFVRFLKHLHVYNAFAQHASLQDIVDRGIPIRGWIDRSFMWSDDDSNIDWFDINVEWIRFTTVD